MLTNFDVWFARNYSRLREKVLPLSLFGDVLFSSSEDVFHDAFLVARDSVLSDNESEFLTIFLAAYKRQSKKYYRTEKQEIRPCDLFWSLLRIDLDEEQDGISKEKRENFANKIRCYAKKTFSADEFQVFEMYFRNGLSQYVIADYYGVCVRAINKRLIGMKTLLFQKFENELKYL